MDPELLALLGVKTKEDGVKALTSLTQVLNSLSEVTGQSDPAQMVGVVSAWKTSSEEAKAARDELAQLKASQAKAEASALLDGLVAEGRLAPSARAGLEKLYSDHGMGALQAAAQALPGQPVIRTEQPPKPSNKPPAATIEGLSDEDREFCRKSGKSPEAFLADQQFVQANKAGAHQDILGR